jgi:hypothetical protein
MMNRISILIALLLIATISGICQKKSIYGYVYDKNTGEILIGASIFEIGSKKGGVTDHNGYFHFSEKDTASHEYEFSYLGYRTQSKHLIPQEKPVFIHLVPQDVVLEEVTVTGNAYKKNNLEKLSIPVAQLKKIPMLGSETDVLRAFQLLPGVQGGDEGSANLSVRGGSLDQNLYLMDNVPIYYVNHLGGFTSVFDIDAINDVNIYKGGFPSEFGGRLSSIMTIGLKNGNKYETKKSLSLGLLSSKFFMEGPLKNDKTTYLFSARVCNVGLSLQAANLLNKDGYIDGYNFYDFTGKVTHQIDQKNTLYVSIYAGIDILSSKIKSGNSQNRYDSSGKSHHNWGNLMTSVRWFNQSSPRLISNTTLAFSRFFNGSFSDYEGKSDGNQIKSKSTYQSLMNDISIKSDFKYYFTDNQKLKFGTDLTLHLFSPFSSKQKNSSFSNQYDTLIRTTVSTFSPNLYLSGDFHLSKNINIQPGVRISSWISGDKSFVYPEPRFLLYYKPSEHLSFSATYSYMVQYAHLLTNQSNTIPNDLWVPTTKKLSPEKSNQFSLGTSLRLPLGYSFSVEGFCKSMRNLIEYEESSFSFKRKNWEDGITSGGKGIAKGFEFLLKKEGGTFDGWISYTLSKATRQFENINNGEKYPFRFDHRHNLNILCDFHLNKKLTLSSIWTYHGGNNITMPLEKYYVHNPEPYVPKLNEQQEVSFIENMMLYNYNGKNGYKTPAYHRLDIGLSYEKTPSSIWHFGIYNAYNRLNAYYFYHTEDGQWKKYSLFPIIPSVSYTYKF